MYYFSTFVSIIQLGGLEILSQMSEIVKIKIPTKLSEEEKNLYTRLYEINGGKKPQKSIMSKVKGVFK